MSNTLILYPALFNCYSKFSRKVGKIICNLNDVTFLYHSDPNGFIQRLSEESPLVSGAKMCTHWSLGEVTHAILFDDGEEFNRELNELKAAEIPLRYLKIPITRVINIKTEKSYQSIKSTPDYEYIGRGSYWGNPYSMYEDGADREEVIRKYKYDFDCDKFPNKDKSEIYKLTGKRLGCFCKPQACHGDVLADFLNAWDDGE